MTPPERPDRKPRAHQLVTSRHSMVRGLPRASGDWPSLSSFEVTHAESPPRTRGSAVGQWFPPVLLGVSPANAGIGRFLRCASRRSVRLPRKRGDRPASSMLSVRPGRVCPANAGIGRPRRRRHPGDRCLRRERGIGPPCHIGHGDAPRTRRSAASERVSDPLGKVCPASAGIGRFPST